MPAAKGYAVWAAFGSGIAGAADSPERAWPVDPRLPALGRRAVLPRGSAPAHTASWAAYQLWRMQHGVAEGDAEIPTGAGPTRPAARVHQGSRPAVLTRCRQLGAACTGWPMHTCTPKTRSVLHAVRPTPACPPLPAGQAFS